MYGKLSLGACTLIAVGLLAGCAASDDSASSGEDDITGAPAEAEPTDEAPRALKVSCTMKNEKYEAKADGQIKIGSNHKILPGTPIKMDFKNGPSANLTVKTGAVEDMKSQTGSIVLVWKKLGVEVVEATIQIDGEKKRGKSNSKLGDYDFDAQCTYTKI